MPPVDLDAAAAQERDDDEPSLEREAAEIALDVVAADDVEHEVDAALARDAGHLRDKILLPVVDRVVGPERAAERRLLVVADRRDHRGVDLLCELDRGHADAARPAVDEDGLPALQSTAVEQVVPDGEVRLGQARGLELGQALRHRQAEAGRGRAIVGVAAARGQRADGRRLPATSGRSRRERRSCRRLPGREWAMRPAGEDNHRHAAGSPADSRPHGSLAMSTSPAFGRGTGPSTSVSTSGGPGSRTAMWRMVAGSGARDGIGTPERGSGSILAQPRVSHSAGCARLRLARPAGPPGRACPLPSAVPPSSAHNIASLLARTAHAWPRLPAVALGARTVSDYASLAARVSRQAGAFAAAGLASRRSRRAHRAQ